MGHIDHAVNDYMTVLGDNGQLLDVREADEVAQGTIPGAINIPLGDLPIRLADLDPSRRVVLLCRSGGRSTQAAKFLTAQGFGDVVNLAGGILAFQP